MTNCVESCVWDILFGNTCLRQIVWKCILKFYATRKISQSMVQFYHNFSVNYRARFFSLIAALFLDLYFAKKY